MDGSGQGQGQGQGPTPNHRLVRIAVFGVIAALYLAWASRFFAHVEDALISYTYARNAANGYGFVPNIGGERVEGFSNPLWVFLLAGGQLLGASPFAASRVLGIVFSVGELALAALVYRDHLRDPASGEGRLGGLVAAAVLACQPGFAMWNHMGLENPLYGFLLSLATWLHLHEVRSAPPTRRFPWSGAALAGLLLTRPEAALYVLLIGAHKGLHLVRARGAGLRNTLLWGALVALPFAAYVAWRIHYFAWPFAMPYYVKLAERGLRSRIFGEGAGLQYLAGGIWTLHVIPLLVLAPVAIVLCRHARAAAALLAAQCVAACAFAVYSGGDWMNGWRWLHILTVPLAPLATAGLLALARRAPAVPRGVRAATAAALFAGIALWPATASPKLARDLPVLGDDIHERLDRWMRLAEAFSVDHATIMDGDQGALTYFAPPGVRVVDIVGLNDVTAAAHVGSIYSRHFFHEYFFEANKPTFYGARKSPTTVPDLYPEWSRDYTVLPAYVSARTKHTLHGGWMRKDVFRVSAVPEGIEAPAEGLLCGLVLRGGRVLSRVVEAGAKVHAEAYWQAPRPVRKGFDYFAEFALLDADGNVETSVTRPLLHQAYPAVDWTPEEILRDPEVLEATKPGAHAVTISVLRAPRPADADVHTRYGLDPLAREAPDHGIERCGGPARVASVTVDANLADEQASRLEQQARGPLLADAALAVREMGLVLGERSARVLGARQELSGRIRREELAVAQHLLRGGHDREAAGHLLSARAEEVRDGIVNELLEQISTREEASAVKALAAARSRRETCEAFRALLDAVAVYPQNAHARRLAEETRPKCWSVLSRVDFGEIDDSGAFAPDNARRVFAVGQHLGLRIAWHRTPDLGTDTLVLDVRSHKAGGPTVFRRTATIAADKGEETFDWRFDEAGRWLVEATLEGRVEASLAVDVESRP